jgi:Na+/H+-dicarboxylate symporter
MVRTAVNVSGDAVVSLVVAKKEDKMDLAVFEDPEAGVIEASDIEAEVLQKT